MHFSYAVFYMIFSENECKELGAAKYLWTAFMYKWYGGKDSIFIANKKSYTGNTGAAYQNWLIGVNLF